MYYRRNISERLNYFSNFEKKLQIIQESKNIIRNSISFIDKQTNLYPNWM